ncbi:MAG TPA: glycyl-radical enzyme activating protein [Rectinemataceae bacterium]|nr:glycyl-radical enzyme activating protein [Rectinemataceae bacterium]
MIFDIQRFSTHDGPGIRTVVFFKGCPLACPWCENPESQSFRPELLYTRSRCVSCGSCVATDKGRALRANPAGDMAVHADPAGGIIIDRGVEPSPELGAVCPALALRIAGREAGVDEIMAEVLKDRSFFATSGGGLTLSGGEPLAHIDFAMELFAAALAEGIDIAIESCLAVSRSSVERAAALPLHWLADLKHTDAAAFRAAVARKDGDSKGASGDGASSTREGAGGDIAVPLGNLEYLAGRGADLTIRVPVIPGFNDDETSMRGILEFAVGLPRPTDGSATGQTAPSVSGQRFPRRRVDLLPYHDLAAGKYAGLGRTYAYPPGLRVESEHMVRYAELGRSLGLDIAIGG